MKLLTAIQKRKLLDNGANHRDEPGTFPVVKLFTPDAQCTWLLSELDEDEDRAFGLCDLGQGMPELGYVSLRELATVRGQLGLPIERDRYFTPTKPLAEYATQASEKQYIAA